VRLARFRKPKAAHVLHVWNIDPTQIPKYYEKQVMLRRGNIQEREGKGSKLRT
jgi:hypothetical protein